MSVLFRENPSSSLFPQRDSSDELITGHDSLSPPSSKVQVTSSFNVDCQDFALASPFMKGFQGDERDARPEGGLFVSTTECEQQAVEKRQVFNYGSIQQVSPQREQLQYIDAHLLFSLVDASENDVWSYLHLSFNVIQNFAKDPFDNAPPPDNSAQTTQKLLKEYGYGGKHIQEATVTITMKTTPETRNRQYQFQLFCSVSEDELTRKCVSATWTKLETCAFITIRGTKKPLRPINRVIARHRTLSVEGEIFLGSFSFDGYSLYHISPSNTHLQETISVDPLESVRPLMLARENQVIIVDKAEIELESKKARAGRPRHKKSQQLLMTRDQVKKVIEIRKRWQGLTPRQRRSHVSEADFYPFLTLNRDEAAKSLPVCTTWFKDVIRRQGVKIWPGRPLRRSGAELEELKYRLATARAALQYAHVGTGEHTRHIQLISSLECEIKQKLEDRSNIVAANVTPEYYDKFLLKDGKQYLNPEWAVLPPVRTTNKRDSKINKVQR